MSFAQIMGMLGPALALLGLAGLIAFVGYCQVVRRSEFRNADEFRKIMAQARRDIP